MANPIIALLYRPFKQKSNSKKLNNPCKTGIYEQKFVSLNGYEQFITIRGCNKKNPVLLILHGGPGSSYTPFNVWLLEWEKYFTIVQWDQAGSGKTFQRNGKSQKLSFDSLMNDGLELTKYLLEYLQKDKLILLGSSVGSFIGLKMIKQEPKLYYAYIGTEQNSPNGLEEAYQIIKKNVENQKNKKGAKLIALMGSDRFKWSLDQYNELMQIAIATCKDVPNMIYDIMLPAIMYDPNYTLREIKTMDKGMKYAMEQLYPEIIHFDFDVIGYSFKVPFFVFQGEQDCLTPVNSAKQYLDKIQAPHKEFVAIKNAGHLAAFCNPRQFLEELINRLLNPQSAI
jgi:pimeloyl-ACP methyl ester carboxylesterase